MRQRQHMETSSRSKPLGSTSLLRTAAARVLAFGSEANEPPSTAPHRYIYVIGPTVGLQKVGIATDPKQRLATLQTAVPFDLHLHLAVAVPFHEAHAIERRAHRLLARSCVRNEWFETTPQEAIEAVKSATAPRQPAKAAAQPTPAEWRINRAERKPIAPPSVDPLIAYGRQFRPEAAFHKSVSPAPLPLFEFAQRASEKQDEQVLVDRVLGALLKRMGA